MKLGSQRTIVGAHFLDGAHQKPKKLNPKKMNPQKMNPTLPRRHPQSSSPRLLLSLVVVTLESKSVELYVLIKR